MDGNTEKIKRKGRGNEREKQYGKSYQFDEKGDPCRSYAQRTASGDETNELDVKVRRKK